MADAAASALVKVIFDKLADEALKKYVRSQGINEELENLGTELSLVQALLNDASQKEVKDEAVKKWLNKLQHVAYDIDDVLDDVATEAMRHELIHDSGEGTSSSSKVRKLMVPTCCTNFSLSHRLSPKLDSITNRLNNLYKAKADLGLVVKDERQKDPNRENETCLPESGVVGRESEKEKLLNKLLGDDQSSSKENFSIVPIVGMGGVGKTTIARLLYNDTKVEDRFDLRAWVCVSDDFDISKISKTIFKAVSGKTEAPEDFNLLQIALAEQLKDRQFLLVLDDVWTENYEAWEKLVRPLNSGACGSRVIITTRKTQLLERIVVGHLDVLDSLSPEDALSLFALHALGVDSFDSYPMLREKGEAIVKKCGTLPLALKAIGRLLRTKTQENWDDVLNSNIWDSKYVGPEDWKVIFPALMLSYHDLDANLKRLFSYCSLFPKDFLFNKEELVLLWMAEGLLYPSNATKSHECFGQECFEALLSRSFFQHAPNDESSYVMHDLMNDLATFVARDFYLRFENHTEFGKETLTKYRHMSFIKEEYEGYQKFEPFKTARCLRTLLAVSVDQIQKKCYFSDKILIDLLPQLPLLRALSLSSSWISEVPDSIGSLKHLRYLNLSQTKITKLPENIGNLFNLQTLIVHGCPFFKKLPKSFIMLKKLRHFDMRKTALRIGELKSVPTLTKIIIGGAYPGFAMTELEGLNNLEGELCINGLCEVQSAMHVHEAKLSLKRLTKLELDWGRNVSDSKRAGSRVEEEVLKELKPDSESLKKLSVNYYSGTEFPKWIGDPTFYQLVYVSIHGCRNCTSLPLLGQLPSLKELFISSMDNVEFIGSELTGSNQLIVDAFPSLEILSFGKMQVWEVWSTNNEVFNSVFPCLRDLQLQHCPKLIEVPLETLLSLEILRLNDMEEWKVWSTNREVLVLPCLQELHIESCPKLIEFSPDALPSVEILWFEDLLGWEKWSTGNAVFPCLRELHVESCPKLIEFSPDALPSLEILRFKKLLGWEKWSTSEAVFPCLRELHIESCPKLIEFSPETLCSLEILQFEDMMGWEIWSTNDVVLPCLRELSIINCPKLVDVSAGALPLLRVLKIAKCGYGLLRSLVQAASSITKLGISYISGLTYEVWKGVLKYLGSVEIVSIKECNEIRYLWESEEEESKVPVNITKLKVSRCSNLVSLGEKEEDDNCRISLLSSLKKLEVENCENMERCSCPNSIESLEIRFCSSLTHVSFPTTATGGGQNLKSIEIWGCEKLIEVINNTSMPMLESIKFGRTKLKEIMQFGDFNKLNTLHIYNCPSIESFPDISMSVLTSLKIEDCKRMESFSALQMMNLTLLKHLQIRNCPSIDPSCHRGVWPPNLCSLTIERLKKPMSEWGPQSFPTSLVDLTLIDEPHAHNFRHLSHLFPSSLTRLYISRFDKLESLSMGIQRLTSLQHLTIVGCPKLTHLPKHLLPSLLSLQIIRCPKLIYRCEGRDSHYYPLMSHIPLIVLEDD